MYGNNFFNPYMYQPYYQTSNLVNGLGNMSRAGNLGRAASGIGGAMNGFGSMATTGSNLGAGLGLKGLLSKFSFSGFLNGASKTLNVVNQAIPIFYQVKPMINNARTMFRIMGAVKDDSPPNKTVGQSSVIKNNSTRNNTTILAGSNDSGYQEFSEENPAFFI